MFTFEQIPLGKAWTPLSPSYATPYFTRVNFKCQDWPMFEGGLKSSYEDAISAVDGFSDPRESSMAKSMEEVCGQEGGLCWKINLIWLHSIRLSWSDNELFSRAAYCGRICRIMDVMGNSFHLSRKKNQRIDIFHIMNFLLHLWLLSGRRAARISSWRV